MTSSQPDAPPPCDRCGAPKCLHEEKDLFCPFYSTYRVAAPQPTDVACPACGVVAGRRCAAFDGTEADRSHDSRRRALADARVGQPPLDPAHPGWTLPVPPDEGCICESGYGMRRMCPLHKSESVPPCYCHLHPSVECPQHPGGQPVSATPEPRDLNEYLSADAEEALRVYLRSKREGSPPEWAMEDAIRAVRKIEDAAGVSATPPEPDAAAKAAFVEYFSDNGWLGIRWDTTTEAHREKWRRVVRAGASPQPEDSRTDSLLAAHRRFHDKVGCPGSPDCYVCEAESGARPHKITSIDEFDAKYLPEQSERGQLDDLSRGASGETPHP